MMKQKPVYQTDLDGFYLYPTTAYALALQQGAFNVPFGAIETEPPAVSVRQVARVKEGDWQVVEDHRDEALYYVDRPATDDAPAILVRYQLGSMQEVNGVEVRYDGGGPVPHWLTATPTESRQSHLDNREGSSHTDTHQRQRTRRSSPGRRPP